MAPRLRRRSLIMIALCVVLVLVLILNHRLYIDTTTNSSGAQTRRIRRKRNLVGGRSSSWLESVLFHDEQSAARHGQHDRSAAMITATQVYGFDDIRHLVMGEFEEATRYRGPNEIFQHDEYKTLAAGMSSVFADTLREEQELRLRRRERLSTRLRAKANGEQGAATTESKRTALVDVLVPVRGREFPHFLVSTLLAASDETIHANVNLVLCNLAYYGSRSTADVIQRLRSLAEGLERKATVCFYFAHGIDSGSNSSRPTARPRDDSPFDQLLRGSKDTLRMCDGSERRGRPVVRLWVVFPQPTETGTANTGSGATPDNEGTTPKAMPLECPYAFGELVSAAVHTLRQLPYNNATTQSHNEHFALMLHPNIVPRHSTFLRSLIAPMLTSQSQSEFVSKHQQKTDDDGSAPAFELLRRSAQGGVAEDVDAVGCTITLPPEVTVPTAATRSRKTDSPIHTKRRKSKNDIRIHYKAEELEQHALAAKRDSEKAKVFEANEHDLAFQRFLHTQQQSSEVSQSDEEGGRSTSGTNKSSRSSSNKASSPRLKNDDVALPLLYEVFGCPVPLHTCALGGKPARVVNNTFPCCVERKLSSHRAEFPVDFGESVILDTGHGYLHNGNSLMLSRLRDESDEFSDDALDDDDDGEDRQQLPPKGRAAASARGCSGSKNVGLQIDVIGIVSPSAANDRLGTALQDEKSSSGASSASSSAMPYAGMSLRDAMSRRMESWNSHFGQVILPEHNQQGANESSEEVPNLQLRDGVDWWSLLSEDPKPWASNVVMPQEETEKRAVKQHRRQYLQKNAPIMLQVPVPALSPYCTALRFGDLHKFVTHERLKKTRTEAGSIVRTVPLLDGVEDPDTSVAIFANRLKYLQVELQRLSVTFSDKFRAFFSDARQFLDTSGEGQHLFKEITGGLEWIERISKSEDNFLNRVAATNADLYHQSTAAAPSANGAETTADNKNKKAGVSPIYGHRPVPQHSGVPVMLDLRTARTAGANNNNTNSNNADPSSCHEIGLDLLASVSSLRQHSNEEEEGNDDIAYFYGVSYLEEYRISGFHPLTNRDKREEAILYETVWNEVRNDAQRMTKLLLLCRQAGYHAHRMQLLHQRQKEEAQQQPLFVLSDEKNQNAQPAPFSSSSSSSSSTSSLAQHASILSVSDEIFGWSLSLFLSGGTSASIAKTIDTVSMWSSKKKTNDHGDPAATTVSIHQDPHTNLLTTFTAVAALAPTSRDVFTTDRILGMYAQEDESTLQQDADSSSSSLSAMKRSIRATPSIPLSVGRDVSLVVLPLPRGVCELREELGSAGRGTPGTTTGSRGPQTGDIVRLLQGQASLMSVAARLRARQLAFSAKWERVKTLAIGWAKTRANSSHANETKDDPGAPPKVATPSRQVEAQHGSITDYYQVLWYAYCCACCGFANEIASYVVPLHLQHHVRLGLVNLGLNCFCPGYSPQTRDVLKRLHLPHPEQLRRRRESDVVIWISHTDPSMYRDLRPELLTLTPDYFIGRSMYELSRIPSEQVDLARALADEIWVPTRYVKQIYVTSGVPEDRILVVPEAVNVDVFSRRRAKPLSLLQHGWVNMWCSTSNDDEQLDDFSSSEADEEQQGQESANRSSSAGGQRRRWNKRWSSFRFFSDFKWEPRKGWKTLFRAFLREFGVGSPAVQNATPTSPSSSASSPAAQVALYVLTHIWFPGAPTTHQWKHNTTELAVHVAMLIFDTPELWNVVLSSFSPEVRDRANLQYYSSKGRVGMEVKLFRLFTQTTGKSSWLMKAPPMVLYRIFAPFPRFCFICQDLTHVQLASLYASVDAFVLPTHGEGWCLPAAQAMSMGLPTIATKYGGQTDFMNRSNSFLINVDAVEEIPRDSVYTWSRGKKWGVPSEAHLRRLMRYVFVHADAATEVVGARAAEHIRRHFSEDVVVRIVKERLDTIAHVLRKRKMLDGYSNSIISASSSDGNSAQKSNWWWNKNKDLSSSKDEEKSVSEGGVNQHRYGSKHITTRSIFAAYFWYIVHLFWVGDKGGEDAVQPHEASVEMAHRQHRNSPRRRIETEDTTNETTRVTATGVALVLLVLVVVSVCGRFAHFLLCKRTRWGNSVTNNFQQQDVTVRESQRRRVGLLGPVGRQVQQHQLYQQQRQTHNCT